MHSDTRTARRFLSDGNLPTKRLSRRHQRGDGGCDARRRSHGGPADRVAALAGRAPVDGVGDADGARSSARSCRARTAAARRPVRDRRGARRPGGGRDRPRPGRGGVRLRLRAPRRPAPALRRGLHHPSGRRGEDLRRACGSTPRRCARRCCTTPSRTPPRRSRRSARRSARRSPGSSTGSPS